MPVQGNHGDRSAGAPRRCVRFTAIGLSAVGLAAVVTDWPARAQSTDALVGAPAWVRPAWLSALQAPAAQGLMPAAVALTAAPTATPPTTLEEIYDSGHIPGAVPPFELDVNLTGSGLTYLPGGKVATGANAFFQPLGTNGRSCITCHQPPSGMGISVHGIQARYAATSGTDPIFAPVDGANCPDLVKSIGQPRAAYSLLLDHGLFRISLPMPVNAEFTVTVHKDQNGKDEDPTGCNTGRFGHVTDPKTGVTTQMISIFRRPLIAANLPFLNSAIPFPPNKTAAPPDFMWDERETSLSQQAIDATLTHAQATKAPTADQVTQIVDFELGVFSAQRIDNIADSLAGAGAQGGPVALSQIAQCCIGATPFEAPIAAYTNWSGLSGSAAAARRASIARGQAIFNTRTFVLSNVQPRGTLPKATCSNCHRQEGVANDPFGQGLPFDLGIGGGSVAFNGPAPSNALPIFEVHCTPGHTTRYHGDTVITNDPGRALISGQCADIETFQAPQLRALAARAPYFSDGSAPTLADVVTFYNKRFSMGLSTQDQQDLVNFMSAL